MKKLLIIEDEREFLDLIEYRAKFLGYDLYQDMNGETCMEQVEKFKPDLILMDINLPNKNGLELISEIRQKEQYQDTPIIALSALHHPKVIKKAMNSGANTYFTKTGDLNDLFVIVDQYLH